MKIIRNWMLFLPLVSFLLTGAQGADIKNSYDPLACIDQGATNVIDLAVLDSKRERKIPLRIYLPAKRVPAPVILFSHGLGGSCEGSAYLGSHWSGRSYIAVFLQHPGSDSAVWKDTPVAQRMDAMRKAASLQNLMLRVGDVPAVLDQLERWNSEKGHVLEGRLNPGKIGMSGHSFGALTTQMVSGQCNLGGNAMFLDPRISAALIMSPSTPRRGTPQKAFGKVMLPWMLMTGTKDIGFVVNTGVESRLGVFPALPPGDKYELVLDGAEHSAFGDRSLPGDTNPRNPNHHRVILGLSTAFWDTFLLADRSAKLWLDGEGAKSLLEKNDRWLKK